MDKKGFHSRVGDGKIEVFKDHAIFMKAERINNLNYLDAEVISDQVNITERISRKTWHMRLGHVAEADLKELEKRKAIPTTGDGSRDSVAGCEECILAKSKMLTFPEGKHCSKAPLDYAHSDVWGPAQTQSIGGGRYFLTIIDDYSRKL
ncbi:uncharacterized mitochondrial protein AtMg00300-like [Salvia splendens]|uniref:uncharacterized mitochondrial protein AtMg00300-like n=1 Tax=Salvia splendens TaxID=180675 RepID=UPI001C2522F4|nr:uncharacterized mitochondrial protein AtMg00300-like [Salvia splendens]